MSGEHDWVETEATFWPGSPPHERGARGQTASATGAHGITPA